MKVLVTMTPYHIDAVGGELAGTANSMDSATSLAWPVATTAYLFPFVLSESTTFVKMFWINGAALSFVDVGIYSGVFARQISSGSTAQSGANAVQSFDIVDMTLSPGTYYLAMSADAVTATTIRKASNIAGMRAGGMCEMASAFPLPATITPATCTNGYVPIFGATTRTLI